MFRAVQRLASTAAAAAPPRGSAAAAAAVKTNSAAAIPDVLVSFGNQADRITFVSHPGLFINSFLPPLSP